MQPNAVIVRTNRHRCLPRGKFVHVRFDRRLRLLRARRGWSVREMAAAVGCSHARIVQLEHGQGRPRAALRRRFLALEGRAPRSVAVDIEPVKDRAARAGWVPVLSTGITTACTNGAPDTCTFVTASQEAGFLADGGTTPLTTGSGSGKMQVMEVSHRHRRLPPPPPTVPNDPTIARRWCVQALYNVVRAAATKSAAGARSADLEAAVTELLRDDPELHLAVRVLAAQEPWRLTTDPLTQRVLDPTDREALRLRGWPLVEPRWASPLRARRLPTAVTVDAVGVGRGARAVRRRPRPVPPRLPAMLALVRGLYEPQALKPRRGRPGRRKPGPRNRAIWDQLTAWRRGGLGLTETERP
jgi:DNA-binding XRE family transcriptional regulator